MFSPPMAGTPVTVNYCLSHLLLISLITVYLIRCSYRLLSISIAVHLKRRFRWQVALEALIIGPQYDFVPAFLPAIVVPALRTFPSM